MKTRTATGSPRCSSDQVLNGFWYKLAAGDTETPEYQIKVQSLPHVSASRSPIITGPIAN